MAKRRAALPEVRLGPWPLGIDNVHPPEHGVFQGGQGTDGSPMPARLVAASDVDLNDEGWPRSRLPLAQTRALTAGQGVWALGGRLLHQDDGALYDGATALVSGLTQRAALCAHAGLIFGTDGATHFELDGAVVRTWGLPVPVLAVAPVAGALAGGKTYLVQAAFVDARGNEGGASNVASLTLAGLGALEVSIAGASPDCTHANLYAGLPDQPTLSFVAQVALAAFPYTIANVAVTAADPPKTAQMVGPLPGTAGIFSFRAFLMLWRDNFVIRSEAFEPHLFHPDNIMQFPAEVRACEGLASGMWIGTADGLWWVTGEGPEGWVPARKSLGAVARGSTVISGLKIPAVQSNDLVALFVTADGLVAGLPGGQTLNLTGGRYRFDAASRASFAYVERDDLRQLLIALEI